MTAETETGRTIGTKDRAPRVIRAAGFATLVLLAAGAAYLIAVRGEALIVDLSSLGRGMWCF